MCVGAVRTAPQLGITFCRIHAHLYVCYVFRYKHIHTHIHIQIHMHIQVRIYIHLDIHMHIHIHMHAHMHAFIQTDRQVEADMLADRQTDRHACIQVSVSEAISCGQHVQHQVSSLDSQAHRMAPPDH